ncbi:hypothetical protein AX17_002994 [Amanita inopinata Kibby_2008]|nr:hypothetical protein AX17_002994 [Amanita inopinata Kibby_2008]
MKREFLLKSKDNSKLLGVDSTTTTLGNSDVASVPSASPLEPHRAWSIRIPSIPNLNGGSPLQRGFPTQNFNFVISRLPLPSPFAILGGLFGPSTAILLFPGAKDAILDLPGFPGIYKPYVQVMYRIAEVAGAGLGMFALADINPGDLILRERPMCLFPIALSVGAINLTPDQLIEQLVSQLTPDTRQVFLSLANCKGKSHHNLRGILNTNALPAQAMPGSYNGVYGGVAHDLSRVNHSCTPNAIQRWCLIDMMFELRALRPIKKGEQVSITYLEPLQTRSQRRRELQAKYSFKCNCPICSLPQVESTRSDIRRTLLRTASEKDNPQDDASLRAWIADAFLPDDYIIEQSMKFVKIMDEEGLCESDVWRVHYPRLTKAYCALKDSNNAKLWAKKTGTMLTALTGEDGGWGAVADSQESTDWWGLRKRI